MEINEWKISTESQFMSLDMINARANSLVKITQNLAKDALMAGVNLILCGEISNYKNLIAQIKENLLERIKAQSNVTSPPVHSSKNRVVRGELEISILDPPIGVLDHNRDKVFNSYRLGLDLAVPEYQVEPNSMHNQFGTRSNDRLGITGYQVVHCSDQVPDSYRAGSDLSTHNNTGLNNIGNQFRIYGDKVLDSQRTGSDLTTGYRVNLCSDQVLDSYRVGLNLTAYNNIGLNNLGNQHRISGDKVLHWQRTGSDLADQSYEGIDFSKPMSQLLGSVGNLSLNLMGGFNIVVACSDHWRQSMYANFTSHDDRLSKLEQTLSSMRSSWK